MATAPSSKRRLSERISYTYKAFMHSWINSGGVSSRGMMPCRASSFNTVSVYLNIPQRMNDRVEESADRGVLKASESILDRVIDLSRVAIPKVPRPQRHRDLSRP